MLAEAAVEITARLDSRDAERNVRRDLDRAVERAARQVERDNRLGAAVAKGFQGAERAAGQAGQKAADRFWRDASGRLRDANTGKWVSEAFARAEIEAGRGGRDAGEEFARSFGDGAGRGGRRAGRSFANAFRREVVGRLARISLGGLLAPVLGPLVAVGFSALAAGAASAAAALTSLVAALAPLAGGFAALPASIAGVSAVMGTLRVALSGVGDAFETALTGDAEEFQEALEGISPAARSVARELRALRPALDEIRNAVQDVFFGPLEGQLTRVADALAGPVQRGMAQVARQLGLGARELAAFASEAETVAATRIVFGSVADALAELRPALEPTLTGLRELVTAIIPAFGGWAANVADLAERFEAWATAAARTGEAMQWVDDALTVMGRLSSLAGDLYGILQSVFEAASAAGPNTLGWLSVAASDLNDFLASTDGQLQLIALFRELRRVGEALSPVIRSLVTEIGDIAPAIGDMATAIGPGLAAAVTALGALVEAAGPGLRDFAGGLSEGVQQLAPALGPLGAAIGRVLSALEPLQPLVGQIAGALGTVLADAMERAAPLISTVADALTTALEPVLPVLTQGLLDIQAAIEPVIEHLGTGLAAAIEQIGPALPIVVQSIIDLGVALANVLVALSPVLGPLGQLAGILITLTTAVPLVLLAEGLTLVAEAGAAWLDWIQPVIAWVGRLVASLNNLLTVNGSVTEGLQVYLGQLREAWDATAAAIDNAVTSVVTYTASLPGRVSDAITRFANLVRRTVGEAWRAARREVEQRIDDIVRYVQGLPDRAERALAGISGRLVAEGRALIDGLIEGVRQKATELASTAVRAVDDAVAAVRERLGISSPSKVFALIGEQAGAGLVEGLRGQTEAVRRAAEDLADVSVPTMRAATGGGWSPSWVSGGAGQVGRFPAAAAARAPVTVQQTINMPSPVDPDAFVAYVNQRLVAGLRGV